MVGALARAHLALLGRTVMSRFNRYFNNHFAACRLLATAHDDCRDRPVQIFQVPGEWDCVGVTDGTDAWVAPVVQGAVYFRRVDVWRILQDIKDGKDPRIVMAARRRVAIEDDEQSTRRRRVINI